MKKPKKPQKKKKPKNNYLVYTSCINFKCNIITAEIIYVNM